LSTFWTTYYQCLQVFWLCMKFISHTPRGQWAPGSEPLAYNILLDALHILIIVIHYVKKCKLFHNVFSFLQLCCSNSLICLLQDLNSTLLLTDLFTDAFMTNVVQVSTDIPDQIQICGLCHRSSLSGLMMMLLLLLLGTSSLYTANRPILATAALRFHWGSIFGVLMAKMWELQVMLINERTKRNGEHQFYCSFSPVVPLYIIQTIFYIVTS
jgi:hypothetical protein